MKIKLESIAIMVAIATLLCAGAASVQSVHATQITVTSTADSGAGTLRDALASAGDGDTINFSVATPATITLTNGQLLVDKSVTIAGPGSGNLAVDGNAASRVFYIAPFKSVSISGLTITNGSSASVSFPAGYGGGILNDHATLTVSNCTVSGNCASYGGAGICNNGYLGTNATLQIVNSTFTSNSITQSGGVAGTICNLGEGNGGSATLQISNSTFSGNSSGGISNFGDNNNVGGATLQVVNSTFSGNLATGASAAGCIRNQGSFGRATTEIINCTFSTNSAAFGGAIYNAGGGENGTMVGIGTMLISNSTFNGNSPYGIFLNTGGTVVIGNTILNASGSNANIYKESSDTVISLGYNLSSDAVGGDGTTGPGGLLNSTGDIRNTDPLLDVLADNGGLTLTHGLLPGSPAINAGDPNFTSPPDFDQRGPGFPRVVCGRIDIGAFEVLTLPATLSSPAYLAGAGFQFSVAGLTCLNYVVQSSTNLNTSNWVSLATNAPPFAFVDTNAGNHMQRFYRAVYFP